MEYFVSMLTLILEDFCQIVEGFVKYLGCGIKLSIEFPLNGELLPQMVAISAHFP